jgi:hypothetical protein
MKFNSQYISKFTDSLLKKQDKFQSLKELGNKKAIPQQIQKCKERLTEEFKFWMRKPESQLKINKLGDIERDIKLIKKLESQNTFSVDDVSKVGSIKNKYGL